MSAQGHDALPGFSGVPQRTDAPAPADPTEDLADEVTSELDLAPRWSSPAPVPSVAHGAANDAVAGQHAQASGGNVLRERYVLESQLGSGGSALVYRAVDLRRDAAMADGRRVAIKLLRPELRDRPQNIARLQREFRQTRAIAHPNVVRFHDLDCDGGSWFIVMELLTGEALGARLRRSLPAGLPENEALRIAAAVGDALSHAHALGVTHGDVKPGNIFLTATGEVRLLDFGVAPQPAETPAGGAAPAVPVGAAATRAYASAEVLAGESPEPSDDVFSLACVAYEMLAGAHPYGRRSADAACSAGVAPQPLAALGSARWRALAAGLELSRAARPTVAELVRGLRGESARRAMGGPEAGSDARMEARPSPGPAAPADAAAHARWRSHRVAAVLAAAALVLAVAALVSRFSAFPGPEPSLRPPPVSAPTEITMPKPADPQPPALAGPAAMPAAPADRPAMPPGVVSFDADSMVVSHGAVLAAIPLRHLSRAPRAAAVNWRVIDGTARLGRDYRGPERGVETFFEGNTFRILYIPIVTGPAAARDRTFSVELTDAMQGASIGANRRIEVTIEGGGT